MTCGYNAVRAAVKAVCLLGLCLAAVSVLACDFANYPSVHFNTKQPDFGKPPPRDCIFRYDTGVRPLGCTPKKYNNYREDDQRRKRWEARGLEALANARQLESNGHFEQSMPHYHNALKHGEGVPADIGDREEIYKELTLSTDRKLLNEYLTARREYEFSRPGMGVDRLKKLIANPQAGFLRAHAYYVLAAIQYDSKNYDEAALLFEQLAKRYPHSLRREAALIMIPRSLLLEPDSIENSNTWNGVKTIVPKNVAVKRSRRALQTLLHDYPHTRFRRKASAWLTRCDYIAGHRVAALESYLHQYAQYPDDGSSDTSVCFVSCALTRKEIRRFRADLRRSPFLLDAYLDYIMNNRYELEKTMPKMSSLAAYARRQRRRLSARVAANLAEAEYRQSHYRAAIAWSSHALLARSSAGKDLALYVRGASGRKSGRWVAAESDFRRLLRRYPRSYLCGAARENLALLYESHGRLDLALDQYYLLNYQEDSAYILDARMTTRQIASYIRSHPHHPQRHLLIYTLGIRQLRDNHYSRALATLSRLPEKAMQKLISEEQADYWEDTTHNQTHDPRKTARELARLERVIHLAHGPVAKAGALFDKALFIYNNRDLLYYNIALWRGKRSLSFGAYWNPKVATLADQASVRQHHFEHECLFRARTQCLEIARRYPHTPTAPKALYCAAWSTRSLASFNGWWRKEAKPLRLWHDSVSLMKMVNQRYPKDPLAKDARYFTRVFAQDAELTARDELFYSE